MPGARVYIPDVEVALDEVDVDVLCEELDLTDRPEGPDQAARAAAKLRGAGASAVAFDEPETRAVVRALTNLRSAGELRRGEMTRLRDLFVGTTGVKPVDYELFLLGVQGGVDTRVWTSFAGTLERGDRVRIQDTGAFRVVEVQERDAGPERLVCQPYDDDWPPYRVEPPAHL
jgi:hypothetical protein